MQPGGRLLGEVFLYDILPNGAGYAEEVAGEIEGILHRARELCAGCPGRCETACYHCLLDYGNQRQHGLLDRHLAREILDFVLTGAEPDISEERQRAALQRLRYFAEEGSLTLDARVNGHSLPGLLTTPDGTSYGLLPTHALRGTESYSLSFGAGTAGLTCLFPSEFDLIRRPFWVWGRIFDGYADLSRR